MVKSKNSQTLRKCPNNAYESLRMARNDENHARQAQLGDHMQAGDQEAFLRGSQTAEKCPNNAYESVRMARIAENQARLAQLGIQKQATDLKAFLKVTKTAGKFKNRSAQKSLFGNKTAIRRSERLKNRPSSNPSSECKILGSPISHIKTEGLFQSDNEKTRPVNAHLPKCSRVDLPLSSDLLPQRCNSKSRGSVYDPIVGICCHSCRQKKLCGEDDCERCGNRDVTKVCIGKTECSRCHSRTGVFCRGCLKVRYGEDIEEVRENKNWMCPHCSEEKGSNPYWICNSSFCLKKRNIPPTGIAIYRAREMGYLSVAHYLADVLRNHGFSGK